VPLVDRTYIASRIYSAVQIYFAHWDGVPELDFETAYRKYLDQILNTADRREFDLATIELLAQLRNGHTGFSDPWLIKNHGASVGFNVRWIDSKWVVSESFRKGIERGDIIEAIDGVPCDQFLQNRRKYFGLAPGARGEREALFYRAFLFPQKFTVTLQAGRTVVIDRQAPVNRPPTPQASEGRWIEEGRIAYIRIPSFGGSNYQDTALELVKQFSSAQSIIIDVRRNGGGSTATSLVEALMDRPFRYSSRRRHSSSGS